MTPLAEVLSNAEALIVECGHVKGYAGSRQSGFCIAGAMRESSFELYPQELRTVGAILLEEAYSLSLWNDAAERTADEVREVLLDAASLAMDGAA